MTGKDFEFLITGDVEDIDHSNWDSIMTPNSFEWGKFKRIIGSITRLEKMNLVILWSHQEYK